MSFGGAGRALDDDDTMDDDAWEDGRYRQCDHDGYPATAAELLRGKPPFDIANFAETFLATTNKIAEKTLKPTIPITDPRFVYRSSVHTDVAATFARVREEMAEKAKQEQSKAKP